MHIELAVVIVRQCCTLLVEVFESLEGVRAGCTMS